MNSSNFTSLCLKVIGVIFILSSLIDYITLAVPFNWQTPQWQIGFVTSIVDRGIVPMVGMALILIGYWIDRISDTTAAKPSGFDLRLPMFILASLLGLIFLLFVPVHLNNLNQAKANALTQIDQGAKQGEEQIQAFLAQVNTLAQNPQSITQEITQRNQVIEAGQFQGRPLTPQQLDALRQQRDQLKQLQDLSKRPPEFKKRIEEIKNQLQTQLLTRKKDALGQATTEALKQGLRIGLSSLMLAIGYSVIGFLGLRGIGGSKTSRPRASAR